MVRCLSRNARLSKISLEKKETLGYGDGEFLTENSIAKRENPTNKVRSIFSQLFAERMKPLYALTFRPSSNYAWIMF
jgi:hypothetical protein